MPKYVISNGVTQNTLNAIHYIQENRAFLEAFKTTQPLNGEEILDEIAEQFAKYEAPIGLLQKLLVLTGRKLHFKADDSGSMNSDTDTYLHRASSYIRTKCQDKRLSNHYAKMTRWEEAEERLHKIIDILAYIPIKHFRLSFLNRKNDIIISHEGITPKDFAAMAHAQISEAFKVLPTRYDLTPIYHNLSTLFQEEQDIYLLTNGVPSDKTKEEVATLVITRKQPEKTPLTFLSCTDNDEDIEWMKEIDAVAPHTAELDDFRDEKDEINRDQGKYFPYSEGLWLISNLVTVRNPDDLDALDEPYPLTKGTLDDLLGRTLGDTEYQCYLVTHPKAELYHQHYRSFARTDILAKQIPDVWERIKRDRDFAINNSPYKSLEQYIPNHHYIPMTQPYYGTTIQTKAEIAPVTQCSKTAPTYANSSYSLWAGQSEQQINTSSQQPAPSYHR